MAAVFRCRGITLGLLICHAGHATPDVNLANGGEWWYLLPCADAREGMYWCR